MNIFDNLSPGVILIGVLVLWFFLGKIVNSISETKNNNDLEKDNTKHSKVNASIMNNANENITQKCPWCAEEIKIDAIVCKHCGAEYEKTRKGIEHWIREGISGYHQTKWEKFWEFFLKGCWIAVIFYFFNLMFS
tara:strand:+ start:68 stop:472 length:405 start_codon:yes stop_codon:yes gene_type:complete